MERSNNNFPEDLLVEIFYWLPVISLLRCRSVCKSWLSIISDPEFAKTHSYRSQIMSHKKASLLMLTVTYPQFNCQSRFVASQDLNYYQLEQGDFRVVGSCNGIICLVDSFCHLWNPSTKQGKRLPIFPKIENAISHHPHSIKQAFGFDSISSDYKVVRFICPTITTNVVPVVQIYSSNTGSWKVIHVHDNSVSRVLSYPHLELSPVIKGVSYMGRNGQLVSFNLHNEMFSVVPFPSSMLRYSEVLDFEGSVAVIYESVGEGSGISLWTLEDIRWAFSYLGGGLLYGRRRPYEGREGSPVEILYACIKKEFKLPVNKLFAVLKHTETLVTIEGFEPLSELVPAWFNPSV